MSSTSFSRIPRYRDPAARAEAEAEQRFGPRVVDIYFHKMLPERIDFRALRDKTIPLPPREPDGYRHVLLLGTTGAGKTTLVRQLIGTDPMGERFPSTSTSKTTIHDTEIILDDGSWRAVVTFVSSDEAREYLNECISAAVRAIVRNADDVVVLRCLLNHANQRFRFSYVLGTGPKTTKSISDFDDEDEEPREDAELFPVEDLGVVDLAATNELLAQSVTRLRNLACRLRDRLHTEPDMGAEKEEDKRALCELVATGNGRKLILAFTHFDEVKGDNLPGTAEKAQHVLASAENVLVAFGEDLGPYAERILRKRLEAARFFLADLQEPLSESTGAGRRTVDQLRKLLKAIDQVIERLQPTEARPVYERMNLVLPIHSAAGAF